MIEAATKVVKVSAAGPETASGEPLRRVTTSPPMMPDKKSCVKAAPLKPKQYPKQSGRKCNKEN